MRPLFNLTRSDRRAVLILSVLALLCLLALIIFGTDTEDATSEEPLTNSALLTPNCESQTSPITPNSDSIKIRSVDPNTVDSATLVHIGISPRRVHTFMRYRAAGAQFRRPEDIARCYSFSDQDIDLLLPLIRIDPKYQKSTTFTRTKYPIIHGENVESTPRPITPNSSLPTPNHESQTRKKFTSPTTVDLNTADTALLRRIPGVGEAISSMIINLRDKLGGFTSLSQLSQIHQITPELYEWFTISDTIPFRKIQINKASFKTLVTHPYISKEQANGILHYIRLYGPIKDIDALRSTGLFTPDQLIPLTPYLEF